MREFLSGEGFLEIETPIPDAIDPEAPAAFSSPVAYSAAKFYALPQSPQLSRTSHDRGLRAVFSDCALLQG